MQGETADARPIKGGGEGRAERIRRDQRRLVPMRRRRGLRADDVTVIEESALRRAIMGSVVSNIMEWYTIGVCPSTPISPS